MKTYLLATLLALTSITAFAQEQFGRNAPIQQLVRATDDGKIELLALASFCRPETKTEAYTVKVPVTENGKTVYKTEHKTRNVTVMVCETQIVASPFDTIPLKAFETDGRPVDAKALAKRIKSPTLVVFSNDGKMIAPYYAAIFKPGTLIIAPQPPPAGAGNAPPPPASASVVTASAIRLVSQDAKPEPPPAVPTEAPAPAKLDLGIKTPKSFAPTMLFARVPEAGKINLRYYSESMGEREIITERTQNGAPETVYMKQLQKFTRSESTQLSLIDVPATTADGKPLTPEGLSAKLKSASVVLASVMGQTIDPFWLQNVKPDVVVLTPPAGVGFGAAAYVAMPAPVEAAPVTAPPAASVPPEPVPAPAPKAPSENNT